MVKSNLMGALGEPFSWGRIVAIAGMVVLTGLVPGYKFYKHK